MVSDLNEGEQRAKLETFSEWAATEIVREFERTQTWWQEASSATVETGVPMLIAVLNTSDRAVGGMIMRFTNEGWVTSSNEVAAFHVIAFESPLAPLSRAVIATIFPFNVPWQSVGKGATGDIVRVWFS